MADGPDIGPIGRQLATALLLAAIGAGTGLGAAEVDGAETGAFGEGGGDESIGIGRDGEDGGGESAGTGNDGGDARDDTGGDEGAPVGGAGRVEEGGGSFGGSGITGFDPNYVVLGADSLDEGRTEGGDCDIAFQLSFSRRLSTPRGMRGGTLGRVFGRNSPLFFAFTQRAWWDICRDSAPFRETNYAPGLFVRSALPFARDGADLLAGYVHQSNGEDGERSIGWDRVFVRARWPLGRALDRVGFETTDRRRWLVDLSLWQPVFDGEHDEAIVRAAGYGELALAYTPDPDLRFRLALRKGGGLTRVERGLAELDVVFPIPGTDVQGIARFANGYGTSLERVGRHGYSVRVGVLFSDVGIPSR